MAHYVFVAFEGHSGHDDSNGGAEIAAYTDTAKAAGEILGFVQKSGEYGPGVVGGHTIEFDSKASADKYIAFIADHNPSECTYSEA